MGANTSDRLVRKPIQGKPSIQVQPGVLSKSICGLAELHMVVTAFQAYLQVVLLTAAAD